MEPQKSKHNSLAYVFSNTGGVPIKCWATEVDTSSGVAELWPKLEPSAYQQACNAAQLPCAFHHVALMADAHCGYGVPVGAVLALKDAVSPNAVGVDIGCGMCAWNSNVPISDINVPEFMSALSMNIPYGEGKFRSSSDLVYSKKEIKTLIQSLQKEMDSVAETALHQVEGAYGPGVVHPDTDTYLTQLGTLGGGNHFVELQADSNGNAWIMLHSGSRGYGAKIAQIYHRLALKMCRQWYTNLPNEELAFFPTSTNAGRIYIDALNAAQSFAYLNRAIMMDIAQSLFPNSKKLDKSNTINIHHNYASLETHFGETVWVHRKGATFVPKNRLGIIPGSMCTKSYIVSGKGNPESFMSCSHGAGRNFSRTEAKKRISLGIDPSQSEQLGSVGLFGSSSVEDECGSAYKRIEDVMFNQHDLVDIVHELRPVAVLKG